MQVSANKFYSQNTKKTKYTNFATQLWECFLSEEN